MKRYIFEKLEENVNQIFLEMQTEMNIQWTTK